jgi:hypothetical protein
MQFERVLRQRDIIAPTDAKLASTTPETGGEHVHTERAFGPGLSCVCRGGLVLGDVSVVAFEVAGTRVRICAPRLDGDLER